MLDLPSMNWVLAIAMIFASTTAGAWRYDTTSLPSPYDRIGGKAASTDWKVKVYSVSPKITAGERGVRPSAGSEPIRSPHVRFPYVQLPYVDLYEKQ